MKKTKKEFKQFLNTKYSNHLWKNGKQRGQRSREYGDYLYTQDKIMFEIFYERWKKTDDDEEVI